MGEAYDNEHNIETVSIERFLRLKPKTSANSTINIRFSAEGREKQKKDRKQGEARKMVELELALRNEVLLREAVQMENECLREQIEERSVDRSSCYVRLRQKDDTLHSDRRSANPRTIRQNDTSSSAAVESLISENQHLAKQVDELRKINEEVQVQLNDAIEGLKIAETFESEVERLTRLCTDRETAIERLKEEILQHYKEMRIRAGSEDCEESESGREDYSEARNKLVNTIEKLKKENLELREDITTKNTRLTSAVQSGNQGLYERLKSEIKTKDEQISKLIAQIAMM